MAEADLGVNMGYRMFFLYVGPNEKEAEVDSLVKICNDNYISAHRISTVTDTSLLRTYLEAKLPKRD